MLTSTSLAVVLRRFVLVLFPPSKKRFDPCRKDGRHVEGGKTTQRIKYENLRGEGLFFVDLSRPRVFCVLTFGECGFHVRQKRNYFLHNFKLELLGSFEL